VSVVGVPKKRAAQLLISTLFRFVTVAENIMTALFRQVGRSAKTRPLGDDLIIAINDVTKQVTANGHSNEWSRDRFDCRILTDRLLQR
jgi:hypothetical protein